MKLAAGNGWRTRATTAGGLRIAEATTAAIHEPAGAFPDRTLAALPRNGILIAAWDYGRAPERSLPPTRRLPYRLAEFRHDRGWEGQPTANVPQYVLFASRRRHVLDVRVFFGRQDRAAVSGPGPRPGSRRCAGASAPRPGSDPERRS